MPSVLSPGGGALAGRSYLPSAADQTHACWKTIGSDPMTWPRVLNPVGLLNWASGRNGMGSALIEPDADHTTGVQSPDRPLSPRISPPPSMFPSRIATALLSSSPGSVPRSTIPVVADQRKPCTAPVTVSDDPTTMLLLLMSAETILWPTQVLRL